MSSFTKEELIAEVNYNLEHCYCSEKTKRLMEISRASLEAEPVAWDYEWASCITCEGPQDFKRIIEHEAPPQWAIHEGQARNLIPLYAAPPAPEVK